MISPSKVDFACRQSELDLILRKDAQSVEVIYLSRGAAMSAAAALSTASLLDKNPTAVLKVAETAVQDC